MADLFVNLNKLKSRIWFWEECIHFERIHRVFKFDWLPSNFAKTFQEQWQTKECRKIALLEIFFSCCLFMQHALHIFSYSNVRCRFLGNRSDYLETLTRFCWLMPRDSDCAAILPVLRHLVPNKFNRKTLSRFTSYRLLTLPKEKARLNYIFLSWTALIKLPSDAWFARILEKLARVRFFPQRTLAKVGSNLK